MHEVCNYEITADKKIFVQNIDIVYVFNPMKILSPDVFRPVYQVKANGKYFYADGVDGDKVPFIKLTANMMKSHLRKAVLPKEVEK